MHKDRDQFRFANGTSPLLCHRKDHRSNNKDSDSKSRKRTITSEEKCKRQFLRPTGIKDIAELRISFHNIFRIFSTRGYLYIQHRRNILEVMSKNEKN